MPHELYFHDRSGKVSVEDIVDGLAIIQQKRGRIVDQGDVEMLALAIKELRKGRPGNHATRQQIIRECWDELDKHIVRGELPGNGCDKSAERNGMVLASNILAGMMGWPTAKYAEELSMNDGSGKC